MGNIESKGSNETTGDASDPNDSSKYSVKACNTSVDVSFSNCEKDDGSCNNLAAIDSDFLLSKKNVIDDRSLLDNPVHGDNFVSPTADNTVISDHSGGLDKEQNKDNPLNPETEKSLNEVKPEEHDSSFEGKEKLPIEKECFGRIQDIIIERVNNIVEKLEDREIREESPDFEMYDEKSESEDEPKLPDSFITIDECESDYSIASEGDIEEFYKKDYFKRGEKDNSKDDDDDDVLILDAVEEIGNDSDREVEDNSKINEVLDQNFNIFKRSNDHEEEKAAFAENSNFERYKCFEGGRKVNSVFDDKNLNGFPTLNEEISGKRKTSPDTEGNSPKKSKTLEINNVDDDKLFENPTDIKVTISNNDPEGNDSPYSIVDDADEDESYAANFKNFSDSPPKPTTSFPNLQISIKNIRVPREEYEYVSNDQEENQDNYNEDWQKLKQQLGSEEERYRAIRERWRNLTIPNPNINLTYRQKNNPGLNSDGKKVSKVENPSFKNDRLNSCTSFYENIISALNKKLESEIQRINSVHDAEEQRTKKIHNGELNAAISAALNPRSIRAKQDLKLTKRRHREMLEQLHSSYQTSLEQLENEHREQVEHYERFMEEVRAFTSFYQGLTVHDDFQLTEAQYEHLSETERMYKEFRNFYEP